MSKSLPELRASILAGILQHVTETRAPVSYSDVFRRALTSTGLLEEEAGEDIRDATSCLIFTGALLSSGFDREQREIRYSAEMELVPGAWLVGFVWRGQLADNDEQGLIEETCDAD